MCCFSRVILGALAASVLASVPAFSQTPFSFGVKGGVPLTTAIGSAQYDADLVNGYDRRYTIGPTVEVHFPFHLSLEIDALYRRNGTVASGSELAPAGRIPVNDWQVPILAKYRTKSGPIRPFADGGFVFRHVDGGDPDNPNTIGVAIGGGLGFKLWRLMISPEIRYTHWPTKPFIYPPASNTNQVDLLVGITF